MENGDHGDLIARAQELVEVESRAPPGCVIDQSMVFNCFTFFILFQCVLHLHNEGIEKLWVGSK